MLKTVALTPADFNRWAEHMNRQIAESGRDRRPFFSPMEAIEFASIERRARFENGLAKPVFDPTWLRMWAIEGPDACLIAHLDLSGSNIPTEQHRATLGIGVEEAFHRQGYGRKLMLQAIEFAQHNHTIT
ncbi:GNAT family N-acetyltransferase [Paraburkholderia heleia]|uniref:GNAT family N-acetyltransferase n=1 Tax=Paraburkholderia heleia TaxID=634127 RepID=UPI0005A9A39D|nr:GNAT family N-acetyltransferase [Paraburkholderia heleia]